MGEDALSLVLANYAKKGKPFPDASSLEDVRNFANEKMKEKGYDSSREPFLQFFLMPVPDTTTIRLSISMRKCDADLIDQKARRMGMNRSEFIVYSTQACPDRATASA